ncbi:MAG: hypothetical protein HYZ81_01970 [Nitrospinae bacterium]|nr:hypothetical protein [Nitrospinota bacterium]
MPAVTICTDGFTEAAIAQREALGMPAHPLVVIPHPLTTLPMAVVEERGKAATPEIERALLQGQ